MIGSPGFALTIICGNAEMPGTPPFPQNLRVVSVIIVSLGAASVLGARRSTKVEAAGTDTLPQKA